MKTQERLKRLIDRIKLYIADEEEVLSELRDLLHDFDGVKGDANYRDKIESSMERAAMFFRQQKSSPPDARAFLLANLATAADLAADIRPNLLRLVPLAGPTLSSQTKDLSCPTFA